MLPRHNWLPVLILALAACATAQAKDKAPASMTDQELDQRRADIDTKLAARAARIKQDLDKVAAFQLKDEKDRLDYERHVAEETKAFYLFLKSVSPDLRKKELDHFIDRLDDARGDFDRKRLKDQKDWFHETFDKPWRSDSLESEATTAAPAAPAAAEKPAAPAAAPMTKDPAAPKAAPEHKAVYKKKTKPAVKKKSKEKPAEPAAQAPAEPSQPPSADQPPPSSAEAPPPPPPGN